MLGSTFHFVKKTSVLAQINKKARCIEATRLIFK